MDQYNSSNFTHLPETINNEDVEIINQSYDSQNQAMDSLDFVEDKLVNYVSTHDMELKDKNNHLKHLGSLYNTKNDFLKNMGVNSTYLKDRFINTKTTNINQKANLDIVNEELDVITNKYHKYKDEVNNKLRTIENNTFYKEKYNSQIYLLKIICGICILLIFVSFLNKKEFLVDPYYGVVVGLIIILGIVLTLYNIGDIIIRDNKVFSEYDYSLYLPGRSSSVQVGPSIEGDIGLNICPKTDAEKDQINENDPLQQS